MPRWFSPCVPALVVAAFASLAAAQATKPPVPVDGGWPRDVQTAAGAAIVYPPQLDTWDGHRLAVYSALAVREKPDSVPVFGVVWADGPTVVDKEARLVTFFDAQVRRVSFPARPGIEGPVLRALRDEAPALTRTLAFDRLTAMLEVAEADKAIRSLKLEHTPPRIVFSTSPRSSSTSTATPPGAR